MQLKEILQIGKNKLKNVSETSQLDVEILVSHVLDLSQTDLIIKDDLELSEKQEKEILSLIERRLKNEPIAYLINQKEFYGLNFYVDENVLIPRPDTEILIESVIDLVESLKFKGKIIDVGMGSGCIPISLAKNLDDIELMAIDISEKALNVARRNIEKFRLEKRIKLQKGDLLKGVKIDEDVIITANLPYVEESAELESDVKDYEPHLALFAGVDGLDCYRELLEQAQSIQPIAIFLEIDPKQVETLKDISRKLFLGYEIEVVKDLARKDRVFVLKRG